MTRIAGVDFYTGQWEAGVTSGDGIAVIASKGARFGIAKVGQAYFLDRRWPDHRTSLIALGSGFLRGAYWFLERDHRFTTTPGFFYPPFAKGLTYRSTTYGGHSDFSVDFNRGTSTDDEGDDVLAAAPGTVIAVYPLNGEVWISHYGGLWRTDYAHMKNITVSVSDTVTRGQKIGEISDVGNATGPHLHHVHWKRASTGSSWVRTKMRIMGIEMNASVADSDSRPSAFGVTGQSVTGIALASEGGGVEYTGASQARRFKNAIGDPTGWLCALDVEAAPKADGSITSVYGANPRWLQVKQFYEEWRRLTDGYPLFLYSSRGYWSGVRDGGDPADARALGFAGLWSADWTQLSGGLWFSTFEKKATALSFSRTSASPNAAGYAGFPQASILQFGSLRYSDGGVNRSLDGNASWMTLPELRTLATTSAGTGPGTGNTFVPDVVDEEESVALDELDEADLTAGTRTEDNSDTIAAGRVISTDPVAGTEVATSTAVDYVVSLGRSAPGGDLDPNPTNPCGD